MRLDAESALDVAGRGADTGRPQGAVVLRVVAALLLIALAYHHTLIALFAYLSSDTPLAYLGLVPLLVLGLALVKARARPGENRLPDRQVDWIIGLPLLAIGLLVTSVLPGRLSYTFWTNRFDVLGLPFFVAGVVALLFGSRVLYRIRLSIFFLLLAWPFPYERVVGRVLSLSSSFALWGVKKGLPLVGGVEAVSGSLFTIGEGSRQFTVNVAPTCAGANSAIGFLLVGGAAVLLLKGRRLAKLAWLATGVALIAGLNVVRLLFLMWAGERFGEPVMMQWLHPYAGLALFVVGCLLTIMLLPLFRIGKTKPLSDARNDGPVRGSSPPAVTSALVLVLILSVVAAKHSAGLSRFDPFSSAGSPKAFLSASDSKMFIPGWTKTRYDQIKWAKQFFGPTSTWFRYLYENRTTPTEVQSLFLDVVNVTDVTKFSTYGLEACYRFHDYRIEDSRWVEVGAAAKAQAVTYVVSQGAQAWTVLAWVSPVHAPSGEKRFERIVLLASVDATGLWRPRAASSHAGLLSFARSFVAASKVTSPQSSPQGP